MLEQGDALVKGLKITPVNIGFNGIQVSAHRKVFGLVADDQTVKIGGQPVQGQTDRAFDRRSDAVSLG